MKLLSYGPDLDPITDGTLLDCNHVVPTLRGIASAPQAVATDITAHAVSAVIGAATLIKVNGDVRVFQGSDTKLYELVSKAWNDVSGGTAISSVTNRWRFAQYGNVSLAASKENVLRESTTGDFTAVITAATGSTVTAPSASLIEVVNDFVFLGDTTGVPGYTGDAGDRWVASAMGDYQDYTPDVATQCVTGRLTSVPGKLTALKKFGDQIVMYKERGMYLGTYVGPPVIWQFPEIPSAAIGTWCQESVISLGTPEQPLHFFVGRDDFYLFDGARPVPVGQGVKEIFFTELNRGQAQKIILQSNRSASLVYIHYPSGGSSVLNSCLVFNYRTRKWGKDNRTIEYAFEYQAGSISYGGLGAYLSTLFGASVTYGDLAALNLTYGNLVSNSGEAVPSVFDASNKLFTLTGDGGQSEFTSHDIGTDDFSSLLIRVTPRWIVRPESASMVNYYWASSGEPPVLDTTHQMDSGRFDPLRSAGWHRFQFTLQGSWELNEAKVEWQEAGNE